MDTETQRHLAELDACEEAREWVGERTLADAWQDCQRGDWMLWYAGRVCGPVDSPSRRKLVGVAAECAALVLPIYEARYPNDTRARDCIEACRRYAAGEIGVDQLRLARKAADAARSAAADADAYAAAAAAAVAADADAYAAAYAAAVRTKSLAQCADIVRAAYPIPPEPANG